MKSHDCQPVSTPEETSEHLGENERTPKAPRLSDRLTLSRRGVLASLVGIGGLSLLSSSVAAQTDKEWKRDRDAQGHKLFNLGELELIDDPVIASTDGTPLELRLAGERALRLEPTPEQSAANILGGHPSNSVASGVHAATIAGGGFDDGSTVEPNTVNGDFGTISGGQGNTASGAFSTVSGGHTNQTPANLATVGGGRNNISSGRDGVVAGGSTNKATGNTSTVGGGGGNEATDASATVGGGGSNTASGRHSTVSGGRENTASGGRATVGGGVSNAVSGLRATVGGGFKNEASKRDATVGGGRANTASGVRSMVGGGLSNVASGGRATVGGGNGNDASGGLATVGGGIANVASGLRSTVGGGLSNVASGEEATVGGGDANNASAEHTTVSGGSDNRATGFAATVGGGQGNHATDFAATVPGGDQNDATGDYSFATGRLAKTEDSGGTAHDGAVVFGDSSVTTVRSQANNQFVVQAGGGALIYSSSDLSTGVRLPAGGGSWSSLSTRTAKTNIEGVDTQSVLEGVERLDISTWEYDSDEDATHMGPMAEDFHAAFDLGTSEQRIATVDADGVALAAIQGLGEKLEEQTDRIVDLEREVEQKDDRIEELEHRLTAVEERLTGLESGGTTPASADD